MTEEPGAQMFRAGFLAAGGTDAELQTRALAELLRRHTDPSEPTPFTQLLVRPTPKLAPARPRRLARRSR